MPWARKLYHNYADKRKEMRSYRISFLLFEESNAMKCLFTYEWVKLPRAHIPAGKGLMGSFLRLASRAAFRSGKARYCGYTNDVNAGAWAGGIVGLKSILGIQDRREEQEQQIHKLCEKYNLYVELGKRVDQLSVGEQQRVEILKALFRNARLLILDEPTSVLTPQEIKEFFTVLRILKAEGHSIILIAHNLSEILEISDRVTILRDGKKTCTLPTDKTNERELSRCMIGRDFLEATHIRTETGAKEEVLRMEDISLRGANGNFLLQGVDLSVQSGEILGVAGIDGNGQAELAEVLTGLRRQTGGRIFLNGQALENLSIRKRWEKGLSYIPSDRHHDGLIMDADVAANFHLRSYYAPPFAKSRILQFAQMQKNAQELASAYQVKTPFMSTRARLLSGGNQQKLILARELKSNGNLTIACQPTRGLDIGATEYLRDQLLERRNRGKSVLLVSTDLGEILALSDRIAVIHGGRIMGVVENTKDLSVEMLGLMMGEIPWRRQRYGCEKKGAFCRGTRCRHPAALYAVGFAFRRGPPAGGQNLLLRHIRNGTRLLGGLCKGYAPDDAGLGRGNHFPLRLFQSGGGGTVIHGSTGLYGGGTPFTRSPWYIASLSGGAGRISGGRPMGPFAGMDEKPAGHLRNRKHDHVQLHCRYDRGYIDPELSPGTRQFPPPKLHNPAGDRAAPASLSNPPSRRCDPGGSGSADNMVLPV